MLDSAFCQQQTSAAMPLVSILMPIFNARAFMAEAIESVLAQTARVPWELLLIDDGSTDDSVHEAQHYQGRFPDRMRLLQHDDRSNHGASAARNLGLRHTTAPLIALLDADDVWLPHMLDTQLALLERHPEAALVYGHAERTWNMQLPFTARGGPLGDNFLPALLPVERGDGLLNPSEPLSWFLADETLAPCTCTVLVRTTAAQAVGGFEEEFAGLYDDQAFYAKIAMAYRVAVTTECVARYRVHASSCCGQGWHDVPLQRKARDHFDRWLAAYRQAHEEMRLGELVAAG